MTNVLIQKFSVENFRNFVTFSPLNSDKTVDVKFPSHFARNKVTQLTMLRLDHVILFSLILQGVMGRLNKPNKKPEEQPSIVSARCVLLHNLRLFTLTHQPFDSPTNTSLPEVGRTNRKLNQ